jgi:hypothetical protein
MPSSTSSSYRFKRFLTSKDPDFASALLIYVRYTPPSIRSNSREITYWLDHFSDKSDDSFYVFGFYRNRELVGFAQAAYFAKDYLYFIDYVTVDIKHRGGNVFFELVDHMKRYLEDEHPEYRYGVTEVMNEPGQDHPSYEKKTLMRLLKLIGFRAIHAPYFQPRLTLDDSESELSGSLLIYGPTPIESIRTDTYRAIIRTVYFKHYLRWASVDDSSTEEYEKHLGALFSSIDSDIQNKLTLVVNGYHEVLPSSAPPPVMTLHRIVSFSFQALFVIILLTATMLSLKKAFGLSNTSFAAIYGLAISSFVAVAGIVSKEAREMFQEFASLAKHFFGRRGAGLKPTELPAEDSSKANPDDQ